MKKGPRVDVKRPLRELMAAYQRDVIAARLEAHGGNMTATAASLSIERSHLYKTCERLGIKRQAPGAPGAPETPTE